MAERVDGHRRERSPFQVGAIALVVLGILVYLGFAKDIPFVNPPYELKAVFADAQNMSTRSPVRIAGVEVGQVKKVEAVLGRLRPDGRDDGDQGRGAPASTRTPS